MNANRKGGRTGVSPAIAAAALAAGLLLVVMVVLLGLVLGELRTSREHIASQDRKVSELYEDVRPVIREAPAAVEAVEPAAEEAASLTGEIDRTLRVFRPAMDSLEPALERLPPALSRVPEISGAVTAIAEQTLPGLGYLITDLSATVPAVRELTLTLLEDGRLAVTLDRARELVDEVIARDLPADAERSARRLRRVLQVQRTTLRVQRKSVEIQRRSLAVQTESLEHIRSIDEKTGGEVPVGG